MSAQTEPGARSRRIFGFLPLILFLGMGAVFLAQLLSGRDLSVVPSVLIGQPAPATSLPPLQGLGVPGLVSTEFMGKVTLVNIWASWCAPCRQEHPLLLALARDGRFGIAGLNYKDTPENALAFLAELGSPYAAVGADANGRAAIDWGVYGVPETFLIGRDGKISFKHVGPLTSDLVKSSVMPEIEKALAQSR